MSNIVFRELTDSIDNFRNLHKWCSQKDVWEWFEQRLLTYDEIIEKYQNKLAINEEDMYIINYNKKDIGFTQIYKFVNYMKIIPECQNIIEFDIYMDNMFIGQGIGTEVVKKECKFIFDNYNCDAIVLRPFSRNIRAIKCYEKCGFKFIKEYDGQDTLGNPEKISIFYIKKP
ncbi:MAG: GNAT family N-acetyltransferase [Firmicutes bacterium]|nr:GNAT family N-acetyltransferase [Bacillota bacterium]